MPSNQRLLEHLASLHLDLFEKRVLLLGKGQDELSAFYGDRGCSVIGIPDSEIQTLVQATTQASGPLQSQFDIVHWACPDVRTGPANPLIEILDQLRTSLLIIECGVSEGALPTAHPLRAQIFSTLKSVFPYAYTTSAQPSHPSYPLGWAGPTNIVGRAVFVASLTSLDSNPFLSGSLPQQQLRHNSNWASELAAVREMNTLLQGQLIQTENALKTNLSHLYGSGLRVRSPYDKLTAADRVRRHLSFRLGATMLAHSKSITGWLTMVPALVWQVVKYRQELKHLQNLPPLSSYPDAHEAERVKQFLSYRLGSTLLRQASSPLGWLTLPWALKREIAGFEESKKKHLDSVDNKSAG